MGKFFFITVISMIVFACNENSSDRVATNQHADSARSTAPVELADSSFDAIGDKALNDFSKGDFDSFMSIYTEDSHLDLAGGDSAMGKANILAYWKKIMVGVDSIRFNTPIYLPIKVNESRQVQTGNYLLMWYNFTLHLKNGKKLVGHTHDVVHLTADKKIDYQLHFADNAPIAAAMK